MLTLSASNPLPFVQPFLILVIANTPAAHQISPGDREWIIDVGGKIELYISREKRRPNQPTSLLLELCKELHALDIFVEHYSCYCGSGGPSMFLRNGALFVRQSHLEKRPNLIHRSIDFRAPTYSGP